MHYIDLYILVVLIVPISTHSPHSQKVDVILHPLPLYNSNLSTTATCLCRQGGHCGDVPIKIMTQSKHVWGSFHCRAA